MNRNKVTYTFVFTLLVVVGLLAMYYLPSLTVGNTVLRKVDLLSDVRLKPVEVWTADSDSVVLPPVAKPAFVDSCKAGMTCIEDYSDSTQHGMSAFYEALAASDSSDAPVRIAYFGDSFIEGDILTGDLRALLQSRFGGSGVGYVPVTSQISGFRPTVRHTFDGWETHSTTDSVGFKEKLQDISNHYYIPTSGAFVTLRGVSSASHLESCTSSTFYFRASDSLRMTARLNEADVDTPFVLQGDSVMQAATVKGNIRSVEWRIHQCDSSAICYGVTMDADRGVIVDNFSTRGSSGQQLGRIPLSTLKAYNRLRPYRLIVLQYGLNVASDGITNYRYYTDGMAKVIEHLKRAFPEASILLIGVGDREEKDEYGNLHTMPAVKSLVRHQQALAAETHIAFWNLFEAMGGEGSMANLVESNPPMANHDYTHINFRGGKHLAERLFEVLMYGKEQYEKRKAYESK